MSDLIDRQAAIDALADMHCKSDEDGYVWIIRSDAWARIDALPSAQPEIIRCKDCKHYHEDSFREDEWVICRRTNLYTDGDKYCAWAIKREDGEE